MNGLHEFFTPRDWVVVFGCLLVTTLVGYCLRGRSASIKDFFLGGRSLPWPAVTGSIIATETSVVTFIVLPGSVMTLQGDFTYLQWAIGSILARIVIGFFFVKAFYEKDIYSPYDFMGNRLGAEVKKLATVLFTVGGVLAQSVRVLVAALPLRLVTPLPFEWCITVIVVFAVGWTLMGGIRTVIWTDVVQLGIFVAGGLAALFWMVGSFDNGWETLFSGARSAESFDGTVTDKMRIFSFERSPELQLTFWVAIFAVPFLNLSAFGVDQFNAQRLFCCRSVSDARKAIIWSSLGQLVTVLMLMVGAALYVFYARNPPTDPLVMNALRWSGGAPLAPDMVFPVWIVTEMPVAVRGLILSGIFAAAISSLDSILTALSQTTLSLMRKTDRDYTELENKKLVDLSRILVVVWGLVLSGFTFVLFAVEEKTNVPILPLALGLTTYTVGPLLGMFIVALLGKGNGSAKGLIAGSVVSFLLVLFVRADVWIFFMSDSLAGWLAQLPTYELIEGTPDSVKPTVASEWMWPITTVITTGLGCICGGKKLK